MIDEIGLVLSAAQTLFTALQCKELKDIFSFLGYESQLQDLQRTVQTVRAVLRDAETKELGDEAQVYIEELKDVVYDADDLFDKFVTLARQKQQIKGGKLSKKVRRFFSRHNPLGFAHSMCQGAMKIRKKLDAIASDHTRFGFTVDPQPLRLRREETCSYVYENNIVGRQDDVDKIVGHLLDDAQHVSFLSIVGIGGLGKTALAQLVFNDSRVTQSDAFPLRIWACVADHDQQQLDVKQILGKILGNTNPEGSTLECLQSQVREEITSKKFLLVLDDVWTEDHHQWLKLAEFFFGGQVRGSWIVVTTRSHETARIIGNGPKHELQGLSQANSRCLFEKIAFGSEQPATPYDDLVEIGREIVEGCAGVPLAIRVAGSVLYGQDKDKWLSFQKIGLSNFKESQRGIMHLLKFSYHQLESPLKSCFTYCALFPKDYEIHKKNLISLWMAQGYVIPLDNAQTTEDAAEEYFSILLRRCFFQDIKLEPGRNAVWSFKLHDLMHDIALNVAGKEMCGRNVASNVTVDKKIRHVGYRAEDFAKPPFTKNRIRSYCYVGLLEWPEVHQPTWEGFFSNWMCLRALDLTGANIISLPESIGELMHLRYLNIFDSDRLEVLPKSINKLCNLQTIKITGCSRLTELPKDYIKSVNYNLRSLEIIACGIKYLTFLGALPHLKTLRLECLRSLEYILASTKDGHLAFPSLEVLHFIYLSFFIGWRDSRMGIGDTGSSSSTTTLLFPQLKILQIFRCEGMKCNLVCPKLERLELVHFNEDLEVNFSSSSSHGVPKIRELGISNLRWLKRAMPMESFHCLQSLKITDDKEIGSLGEAEELFRSCSSSLKTLLVWNCGKLRRVTSGGLEHLTCLERLDFHMCDSLSLSKEEEQQQNEDGTGVRLPSLRHLRLSGMDSLPRWIRFSAALETLEIEGCFGMEAMPEWMPKLTFLRELLILGCSKGLEERCQNPNGEDWPLIQHIPSVYITSLW